MNILFGQDRRGGRWLAGKTMVSAGLFIICSLALAGCGRTETANPPPASASVTPTSTSPAPASMPTSPVSMPGNAPAPGVVMIAASSTGGADLRQLNHAYLRWIAQNRRRPKNYEDFIVSSGIQVPPAPAGKRYLIDKNGFIALASQ